MARKTATRTATPIDPAIDVAAAFTTMAARYDTAYSDAIRTANTVARETRIADAIETGAVSVTTDDDGNRTWNVTPEPITDTPHDVGHVYVSGIDITDTDTDVPADDTDMDSLDDTDTEHAESSRIEYLSRGFVAEPYADTDTDTDTYLDAPIALPDAYDYTDAGIRVMIADGPSAGWVTYYRNAPANRCVTIVAAVKRASDTAMASARTMPRGDARTDMMDVSAEWFGVVEMLKTARVASRPAPVVRTVDDYAAVIVARCYAAYVEAMDTADTSDVPADMIYTAELRTAVYTLWDTVRREGSAALPSETWDTFNATRTRIHAALVRPAFRKSGTTAVTGAARHSVKPRVWEWLNNQSLLGARRDGDGWIPFGAMSAAPALPDDERCTESDYAPTSGALEAVFTRRLAAFESGKTEWFSGVEYRKSAGVGTGASGRAAIRCTDIDALDENEWLS